MDQIPAHDGAIPPLQDIELQEKHEPDSPTLKHDEDPKILAAVPPASPAEDEEGGPKGVRAVIGGFNISFCELPLMGHIIRIFS